MRLYLDENCARPLLVRLLKKAGHDVQVPADVGLGGKADAIQMTQAVNDQRVCLTENYADFENLHGLILACQGHHLGILVVRRDNNPKKDLSEADVVRSIANLVAAGAPIADQYIILNHWR